MVEQVVTVINKTGIHARPAAVIVKTAKQYQSAVSFDINGTTFDAKNLMKIVAAGITHGTNVKIICDGSDEANAVKELKELFESGFGEE